MLSSVGAVLYVIYGNLYQASLETGPKTVTFSGEEQHTGFEYFCGKGLTDLDLSHLIFSSSIVELVIVSLS